MYHDTTFKLQSTNSSQEFALHNWDIFYGISIGCVDSFRILITGSSDSSFGESFTLAIYETETFKVSPVSLSNMYQAPVPKHMSNMYADVPIANNVPKICPLYHAGFSVKC